MLRLFARLFLMVIGLVLIVFCFALAWMGCWRLYGWTLTGRFIPPGYTRLKGHDLIYFSTEPIRASLEIAGSLSLVVVSLGVMFAVAQLFRHGLAWVNRLPYVLCPAYVLVFISTVSGTAIGHVDWVLPTSVLYGGLAVGMFWIDLRQKGLPLTATLSDVQKVSSHRNHPAHARKKRTFELIAAAILCLFGILKLVDLFSH